MRARFSLRRVLFLTALLLSCGDPAARMASPDEDLEVRDAEPMNETSPAPDAGADLEPAFDVVELPDLGDASGPPKDVQTTLDGRDPGPDAGAPVPALLVPPALPEYSMGACPEFTGGPTNDTSVVTGFPSGGDLRKFRLIVPPSYDGTRAFPLVIAWHWLNAQSSSFVSQAEMESAAEEMGFIALLPDDLEKANGDKVYFLNWPFAEAWGMDKELVYFDDLLACVTQRFNVDPLQIHGIGVSAGALWLAQLSTTPKVNHLATVTSLSGGLGQDPLGVWSMMFAPQPHKFPAIVLWGGPTDNLIIVDFQAASIRYRDALLADGHVVVACTHDAGHGVPPIDSPPDGGTRFRFLWKFMLDHPFGTPPGTSPWQEAGLPPEAPAWCALATP